MQVESTTADVLKIDADAIVLGVHTDGAASGAAASIDRATDGLLTALKERGEFTGKKYELLPLIGTRGVTARQVMLVGLGNREGFDAGVASRAAAAAARQLAAKKRPVVAYYFESASRPELVESALCGAIVGCQGQDLYRAEKSRHPFEHLLWHGASQEQLASGRVLGESVNLARRLVNEPPEEIYPESFAERAQAVADECSLECEIWDEQRLSKERCGALLAVAKGSSRAPRLVILRYRGAKGAGPPLAIVGKGVTFDSGGLSIKPCDGMLTMKCDMAGAATMLAAMRAIALLKLPVDVVGLTGLVENMLGPAAMKVGDVLTSRAGKTIEVQNTDAEGRLVLADVLAVAVDLGVAKIVDLATLTGACVVALGQEVAGVMTNNQPWCDDVLAAGRRSGEPLWQLPMFPDVYDDLIKSEVADIKNVGEGRWGGAISAAKFLEQFVGTTPWTHIDIAGPAFRDKPKPWAEAGASGQYVRTLVEIARAWKPK